LREFQEKKSFSLSEKPAIKRQFGTKSKRSSKKGKVGIQTLTNKSVMEIEFENDDSDNDLSDGDAEGLFFSQGFSRMAKNGLNV
jgi:hypothetical protein